MKVLAVTVTVTVTVLALGAALWFAVSALAAVVAVAAAAALLAAATVFATVRLARSSAESRRRGHQAEVTEDGRTVYCDGRRAAFQKAVEVALKDDARWDDPLSPADANLIVARRGGRIENEVSR